MDPQVFADSLNPDNPPPKEAFGVQAYLDGNRLAVVGPVWEFSPRMTYERFVEQYKVNPVAALRDLASCPPRADRALRLYPSLDQVIRLANPKRRHPFTAAGTLAKWFKPTPARYYMHFDLSGRRDATGVALVHAWGKKIVVDFVLEVTPQDGRIRISHLARLVTTLQRRGFYIARVSTDQWGSIQFRDDLEARGIQTARISVDRTTTPHETLYELLHAGRLDFYLYRPLLDNLESLVLTRGGRKIDHEPGGKKDVADALAGAVTSLLESEGWSHDPEVLPVLADDTVHFPTEDDLPEVDEDGLDADGDFDDFLYVGQDPDDEPTDQEAPGDVSVPTP